MFLCDCLRLFSTEDVAESLASLHGGLISCNPSALRPEKYMWHCSSLFLLFYFCKRDAAHQNNKSHRDGVGLSTFHPLLLFFSVH